MIQKEDRELELNIDYECGELSVNCPGFSYGILMKIDSFSVWVISEIISQDNDGIFTQGGHFHKTEKTITVLRAVANGIVDLEENTREA